MLGKLHTFAWFIRRPLFWPHMWALIGRKFDGSQRHDDMAAAAEAWAAPLAVSIEHALREVGVQFDATDLPAGIPKDLLKAGEERAAQSDVRMGGPGDLDLIFRAILVIKAKRVIETGVAYGWSSLAALAALERTGGDLVSVDMPYPKAANEPFVGIVVPRELRSRWTLVREPDRNGIVHALEKFGGVVDLVHYDSDKSYAGRAWAFPLLWRALAPGGLFISDDIQDNFGFRDFAISLNLPFAVTRSDGKFVGLIRKPLP